MAAAPSRRSFVVGWKAFRCFDDELGIIPSHSADAPALGVLELDHGGVTLIGVMPTTTWRLWGAKTRFRLQIELVPTVDADFGTPQAPS